MEDINKLVGGRFKIHVWTPDKTPLAEAWREAIEAAESADQQGFNTGVSEILTKMSVSDEIIDFKTADGDLAAFGCLIGPVSAKLAGDQVTMVYANGILVNPTYKRLGISEQFYRVAANKGELVLGHTQSPLVVKGFRTVFATVWPSKDRTPLSEELADAIGEFLHSIGRPRSFDRTTGFVKNLYPGSLYEQEDRRDVTGDGTEVAGGDGYLIIGFRNKRDYFKAVKLPAPSGVNGTLPFDEEGRANEGTTVHAFGSVIVGAGHAGQDLHLRCINKAAHEESTMISGEVALVECDPLVKTAPGLHRFADIASAAFDPKNTVIHVTTGPGDRVSVVRAAAELGFKFFILEKPLTASRSQLEELLKLVKTHDLKVVVNFPWLGTPLTRRLKEIIDSREHGNLLALTIVQSKSRSERQREATGCTSALDIETPHEISLALHLAGDRAQLLDASCKSFAAEAGSIPFMGGASVLLLHDRAVSNLRSDLDSREKVRRIDLVFEDGWRCCGHYPPDGEDGSQDLMQYNSDGCLQEHEKFFDDPLTSLFIDAYHYFAGTGPIPLSNLELAVKTTDLISTAKVHCGIEIDACDLTNVEEDR